MGVDIYLRGHAMLTKDGEKVDGFPLSEKVYRIANLRGVGLADKLNGYLFSDCQNVRDCDAAELRDFAETLQDEAEADGDITPEDVKAFTDAADWIDKIQAAEVYRFVQISISF